jgi:hypothetical protein
MHLHSIFLTGSEAAQDGELPPLIAENIRSFKDYHPGGVHTLYTDASLRAFIRANMSSEVLWAYDELVPLSYKADLGRLCLLHVMGGLYSDVANFFFSPYVTPRNSRKLAVLQDRRHTAPWITITGLIAAPPRMPVFLKAAEQIARNARSRYYGKESLCPTGPVLFGREIARWVEPHQISLGEVITVNDDHAHHTLGFLSETGSLVAIRRKWSDGISSLGVKVPPSYGEIYQAKEIYRSEQTPAKSFDPAYMIQRGFIEASGMLDNAAVVEPFGRFIFNGPFVTVPKGNYEVRLALTPGRADGLTFSGAVDIVANGGKIEVVPPHPLEFAIGRAGFVLNIKFSTARSLSGLCVRIQADQPLSYGFRGLEIIRI